MTEPLSAHHTNSPSMTGFLYGETLEESLNSRRGYGVANETKKCLHFFASKRRSAATPQRYNERKRTWSRSATPQQPRIKRTIAIRCPEDCSSVCSRKYVNTFPLNCTSRPSSVQILQAKFPWRFKPPSAESNKRYGQPTVSFIWCAKEDLNLHVPKDTSPSS